MRRRTKVWLITAASLVMIGGILFSGVMTMLKWDFTGLSTVRYETNIYEVPDPFEGISIDTATADIEFARSDNGGCRVECREEEKAKHSVTVEEGVLNIELVCERVGYFGLNIGSPKITVYLPEMQYTALFIRESTGDIEIPKDLSFNNVDISLSTGDVDFCASASEMIKIKTSTGDICVENISVGALDLAVSTGKVTASGVTCEGDVTIGVSTGKTYLTDTRCKSVLSRGNTGDIFLNNVVAAERFSIERSTGSVNFDRCDAAEIYVKTDTGDVAGTFLTDKEFITRTDTGSVEVPETAKGGRCEITTSTGDIGIHKTV